MVVGDLASLPGMQGCAAFNAQGYITGVMGPSLSHVTFAAEVRNPCLCIKGNGKRGHWAGARACVCECMCV